MRTAMLVIWWVGLVGALVPTIIILKQALLVVGTLRDILHLAHLTRTAARGIAANVLAVQQLQGLGELVAPVPAAIAGVARPLTTLAARLDREVPQ